jgi:branched-subunit amino acid transport protein
MTAGTILWASWTSSVGIGLVLGPILPSQIPLEFVLRQASVRALAHRELPPSIGTILRHAALAVMASLVVSATPSTGPVELPTSAAIAALAVVGLVARRTRSIAAAIATGVATYAAIQSCL